MERLKKISCALLLVAMLCVAFSSIVFAAYDYWIPGPQIPEAEQLAGDAIRSYDAKNYREAFELFSKAASKGHTLSMYMLGKMYYDGEYVKQDIRNALYWWTKAAEAGNKYGQLILAKLYAADERESGITQDYGKAFYWAMQAAEQGDMSAQYEVGTSYLSGRGVRQNVDEAIRWYKKAAAQGNQDAKRVLEKLGQ